MRRWVVVGVVVVLAAVTLGVFLNHRDAEADQATARAQWQTEVAAWEVEQSGALVVPDGAPLSEVVTGAAMAPIGADAPAVASIDDVNIACTRLTAFADMVQATPGPPAPPADLEPSAEQSERFDADLAALNTFQHAVTDPAATVRTFCGSYVLLVMAHQSAGEDASGARSAWTQALQTQCPLPELSEACAALLAGGPGGSGGAGGAGDGSGAATVDLAPIRQTITEQLAAAEATIDEAATAFAASLS